MASRHLKTTLFLNFSEEFWVATISKTSIFGVLRSLLPLRFRRVLPAAWTMGGAAPEAEHRCIGQPRRATFRSSSGFSRPRQRWMRRRMTAAASDEDLGRENPLEAMGSLCDEVDGMLMVQVLNTSLFCGKCFAKTCGTDIVCCSLCSRPYCSDTSSWTDSLWIDDFSLETERHVHHNPNYSDIFRSVHSNVTYTISTWFDQGDYDQGDYGIVSFEFCDVSIREVCLS